MERKMIRVTGMGEQQQRRVSPLLGLVTPMFCDPPSTPTESDKVRKQHYCTCLHTSISIFFKFRRDINELVPKFHLQVYTGVRPFVFAQSVLL